MNLIPTSELLKIWIESYVPDKDLFFLRKEDLVDFEIYLDNVLLIPKEEFFSHSAYNHIQLVNSYEYWKISKEIQYIIVAPPYWFTNLPMKIKKLLNTKQFDVNRGLILPFPQQLTDDIILDENIITKSNQRYIVLQRDMWTFLPFEVKSFLMKEYAKRWDSWNVSELPASAPKHLQKFANTFPEYSGSNCLSATLFAITGQEWIIYEWVHPKTFVEGLKKAKYSQINIEEHEIQTGDVVVWKDKEGNIQHASYYIAENLFFNKDGQTFFNPWKIVSWTELQEEWNKYKKIVYRNAD